MSQRPPTIVRSIVSYFLSYFLVPYLCAKTTTIKKRFAIYKPDGIGDFVLSSEALRICIDAYGSDNVALIVSYELVGLAKEMFPGLQILPIVPAHSGWRQKLKGLRTLRAAVSANTYEQVICLRHYRTYYDNTILRSLRATRVFLLTNQSSTGASSAIASIPKHFQYVRPNSKAAQAVEEDVPREWSFHASVLSACLGRCVSPESLRPKWDVLDTCHAAFPAFMLISPLAGRGIRDLPLDLVKTAAYQAFADGLANLVVTGTRQQSAQLTFYAESLRANLPGCSVEVAHPEDLSALTMLIARASLIFSAETSTAHIATALDRPALILIGGGHYGWFAPWRRSAKQVWLTNRLACFNCSWRCPYNEPFCITNVTSCAILAALPKPQYRGTR